MAIEVNLALQDIDGLSNLESIGEELSNLESIGEELYVVSNNALNDCCVLLDLAALTTGLVTVNNSINCYSLNEIAEVCADSECPENLNFTNQAMLDQFIN